MKIKVLTSYKPGTWNEYAKRAVDSVLQHWPQDTQVVVYHEAQSQDIFEHPRVEWLDAHEVQPELLKFKNKYKDDPVANGEIDEIPNGVRRPIPMAPKGSFLWNAVRFANKVFCVTHALRNSSGYDYLIWLDADTYSFRPIPKEFFEDLLPSDCMLTYLGRENPNLNDGGKYPECGFVGYNLNHPDIQNYTNDWEKLYVTDKIFELIEWTDCSTLWHLSKKYQKEKNVKVNDIGYWKGVKGHHVFINSELGLYMDHFKGNRKLEGKSKLKDFRDQKLEATKNIKDLDYWKKNIMRIEVWPMHGPQNSKTIFKKFIESMQASGDEVHVNRETNGDVAVIWSVLWRGRMQSYKSIWDRYRSQGKPVIVIEVGGLRRNLSFKIGINGINRDADFANQEFDDKRWPLFKYELRPWNPTGDLIVICGQHDASEQWKGLPRMSTWIEQQITEIRKYTTRPILVRPHPRNTISFGENKFKNVKVRLPKRDFRTYDDTDFKATLERTWAVVNHSSNPAMEAVMKGIPVFVSESSLCHDVGNIKLADINTPAMPNRLTWANKLAYTEWFEDEIEQGLPWTRIRARLEEKYIK